MTKDDNGIPAVADKVGEAKSVKAGERIGVTQNGNGGSSSGKDSPTVGNTAFKENRNLGSNSSDTVKPAESKFVNPNAVSAKTGVSATSENTVAKSPAVPIQANLADRIAQARASQTDNHLSASQEQKSTIAAKPTAGIASTSAVKPTTTATPAATKPATAIGATRPATAATATAAKPAMPTKPTAGVASTSAVKPTTTATAMRPTAATAATKPATSIGTATRPATATTATAAKPAMPTKPATGVASTSAVKPTTTATAKPAVGTATAVRPTAATSATRPATAVRPTAATAATKPATAIGTATRPVAATATAAKPAMPTKPTAGVASTSAVKPPATAASAKPALVPPATKQTAANSDKSATNSDTEAKSSTTSGKVATRKPPVVAVTEETKTTTVKKSTAAAEVNAFMKSLFTEGVTCVTAPDGIFPVKEDQRSLFALFSNGRFLVSENAKFDGRVLSFEVMARKRKLQVNKPEYVQQEMIDAIYEHAITSVALAVKDKKEENEEDEDTLQMQKDFVTIIARAAAINVSDIHVVVANKTSVMFRVNGLMQTEIEYSKEWGESFVRAAFSSADISDANYAQNEYQAAQKLGSTPLRGSKGKLMLPKNVLGIRLQFNPIAFGSRYLVMRLLYADEDLAASSNSLMALGFAERDEEIFFRLRSVPTGIVIISGPTGSGKSTTLQRNMIKLLEERNFEVNLLTVEDPPEYPIKGARQMPVTNAQTDAEKDIEFNKALAATLRSDPDVLMIGEVRTLSAAQLAFKGALSGHGVWTTLHANSAPAILMRLRDMGMEAFKLQDPSIMKGMIAQRLFRKLCPYCRIPAAEQPNHPAVRRLFRAFDEFGVNQCYLRGPGCSFCNYKGVKGRTVVGELVMPDAKLLELLINNRTSEAIDYWTTELNGRTLKENAVEKMLAGVIDIEEIERWCGLLDEKAVY